MKTHAFHRMTMRLTHSASAAPVSLELPRPQPRRTTPGMGWRIRCRTEIRGHVAVLEQATMAAFEGYLSGALSHRAVHSAQRLQALAKTLGWREETCIAQAMTELWPPAACGLVQALQLSELLAAWYRAMAPPAVGQPPTRG